MDRLEVTLRVRIGFIPGLEPFESQPTTYPDEASAIAWGKERWPQLCEYAAMASAEPGSTAITVLDHQGQLRWERKAPIAHEPRDPSLTDEAWVLRVLDRHGPLPTPRLEVVAGLKHSTVMAQLRALQHQGRIRKCGKLPLDKPGRQADLWDMAT